LTVDKGMARSQRNHPGGDFLAIPPHLPVRGPNLTT
jgi:hypothetical protein